MGQHSWGIACWGKHALGKAVAMLGQACCGPAQHGCVCVCVCACAQPSMPNPSMPSSMASMHGIWPGIAGSHRWHRCLTSMPSMPRIDPSMHRYSPVMQICQAYLSDSIVWHVFLSCLFVMLQISLTGLSDHAYLATEAVGSGHPSCHLGWL